MISLFSDFFSNDIISELSPDYNKGMFAYNLRLINKRYGKQLKSLQMMNTVSTDSVEDTVYEYHQNNVYG